MLIVVIYLCDILGCFLALASPPVAWKDIKGENVYIEPINNCTTNVSVDGRIIRGREAPRNSAPYQVGILMTSQRFCGGSLISRNFVLTAAHCTIEFSSVVLVFGAHKFQTREITQVRVTSARIINHPYYRRTDLRNDIALVKLPNPINTNRNIEIIPLAPRNANSYEGYPSFLTGWGKISNNGAPSSSTLQEITLKIIKNTECAVTYGNIILDSNICTSGAGAIGMCYGDSGGPLVIGGVQVGVASFLSSLGCQYGHPSVFSRVSSFRSWIAQNSDVAV